jgi:hypothetical protein
MSLEVEQGERTRRPPELVAMWIKATRQGWRSPSGGLPGTTLGHAVRRVIQEAPRDSTGTLAQNLLMVRDWIQARHRIALDRWGWSMLQSIATFATVPGQTDYPLAQDYREYLDFTNYTIPEPIYPRPLEYLDRLDPGRLQHGPPRFFSIFGRTTVHFYPIPDAPYTILYRYNAIYPDPVVSSDLLAFPNNAEFVITGALANAYGYLGGVRNLPGLRAQAQQYEQAFEHDLDEAIRTDRPNVIQPYHPIEQEDGSVWYSADDYRVHDMGFAHW